MELDLALNNLQRLICHKTQTTNKPNYQLKTVGDFIGSIVIISN